MAVGATTIGLIFLVTGGLLLVLLREPIRQPEKPGSRWFALAVVGIAFWPLCLGTSYLLADETLSIVAWGGRAMAATVISVSWFLVAVEYTTQRRPSPLLIAGLGGYVLVDLVVTGTNSVHHLLLTDETTQIGTVLVPAYGPWFWAQTVINYGFIFMATALLAVEWNRSSGLQRRQAAILTVAVVPPILANVGTLVSVVPSIYDMTPFGLAGSGLLLTWALYRVEFLDVVPVARETAMEEMRDAVVTLDDEDRVVDCNATARRLFDVDESYGGMSATDFFSSLPHSLFDRVGSVESEETGIAIDSGDGKRHYSVSISPVRIDDVVAGRVVVLRDVTPLVERERELERRQRELERRQNELDLLRQVLTRVIRHNLRNALTTIHITAREIADGSDDERTDLAERILRVSNGLLDISDKAGHVERIVSDAEAFTYDLPRVVADVVDDCRERYPAVTFELDTSEPCSIRAGPGLEVAIDALVENAAEYGDEDDPRVSVRVRADGPRIVVADNGPGIADAEVAVLEARQETPLEHGSGIGLWLAKWVADRAGAALEFDAGEAGTTVTMDFGAAPELSDRPSGAVTTSTPTARGDGFHSPST